MNKKRLLALLMASSMLALTACGGGSSSSSSSDAAAKPADTGSSSSAPATTETPAVEVPTEDNMTDWEKKADIYNMDQTEDELYEAAKAEGAVVLYSISSRCPKVADAFMEKYPGIEVEANDISTNELLEKVTREHDSGIYHADVVHVKDQDGSIYMDYVLNKIFYNYQPTDICAHIDDSLTEYSMPLYIELTNLFYNMEDYPDGSPINNIWELTDAKWNGKITMQNPLDNVSWQAWIAGFCCESTAADLEAAYKEYAGTDLVLDADCENAGYQFLKNLKANNPIYCASSDESAQAVGTKGQNGNSPIGFSSSSKIRKNASDDWCLGMVNIYPTVGIPAINTLYVVEGCEHPNAAKLLIRFMLGGTDGTDKGYSPFNTLGGWPVRDDIAPAEGSFPYEDIYVADFNPMEIYDIIGDVADFWLLA